MKTRAEHVEYSKTRALQYVESGELQDAFASLVSDLRNHPDTANHPAAELGMMMLLSGHLDRPEQMREFIQGVR